MTYNRSVMIGLVLTLASFAASVWLYPHLPEPRVQVAFLTPSIIAFVWLLLIVLPRVSPHGFRMDLFLDVFGVVDAGIVAVLTFLHLIILLDETGRALPLQGAIFVAVGILLVFLGNFMGKLRKNFFVGVRTPWTLASDEVWARTHRLAGWLFAAAGTVIAVDGLLGSHVAFLVAVIILMTLTLFIYSLVLYRRIEGFGPDPSP